MKTKVSTIAVAGLVSLGLFGAGQAEAAWGCNTTYSKPVTYTHVVKQEKAENTAAPAVEVPKKETPKAEAPAVETAPEQAPKAQPVTEQADSVQQEVLNLVNKERAKAGAKPLQLDAALTKAANAKSQDMNNNRYFSHQSPTYGSPFEMMKQFGVSYKTAGENIAMGQKTPADVMEDWMNSPGHRANIMNKSFTHIGIGYDNGYWTQMFIGK